MFFLKKNVFKFVFVFFFQFSLQITEFLLQAKADPNLGAKGGIILFLILIF